MKLLKQKKQTSVAGISVYKGSEVISHVSPRGMFLSDSTISIGKEIPFTSEVGFFTVPIRAEYVGLNSFKALAFAGIGNISTKIL